MGKKDFGYNFSCIVVDLIHFLPGVENGEAKMVAIELVRSLSKLLPFCKFVLLTSPRSHDELSSLDSANVRRLCVSNPEPRPQSFFSGLQKIYLRIGLRAWLTGVLPPSLLARLKTYYPPRMRETKSTTGLIKKLKADLLFCPFTAPFLYDPAVPVVSIIYDLQYHYYPQFFGREDYYGREKTFKEACRLANQLVCISEYVRGTVLENSDLQSEQVNTILIRLSNNLKKPEPAAISAVLQKYGLKENKFLLYPANFWLHKNHLMLFTAFNMYRSRHPESTLRLVCTGAPDQRMASCLEAVRRMKLDPWILFPGFLSKEDFTALLSSCKAMIFPSLYEGFGMPVLEAMAFGKPVLCSNVTSLPEVAGEAALYFDPKKPNTILSAIERIFQEPELPHQLISRGYERIASYGNGEQMACEYLQVFKEAMGSDRLFIPMLHGIYADGWTQEKTTITYNAAPASCFLQMTLELPSYLPYKHISVTISDGKTYSKVYRINRGQTISISYPLKHKEGSVQLSFEPIFQPKKLGMNDDERYLGCICQECLILDGSNKLNLLEKVR